MTSPAISILSPVHLRKAPTEKPPTKRRQARPPISNQQPLTSSRSPLASIHELVEHGLQRAVEALVFAADVPVSANDVADVYAEVTGQDRPTEQQIIAAIDRLNRIYEIGRAACRERMTDSAASC